MTIRTVLAAAALALALPARADTTLLFNSFLAPQHPINTRVLKPWADDIEKATAGRVKIQIAPASLAAPPQQMDGVIKGVMDGAYIFNGFLQGKVALPQVAHLPFVNSTSKASSVALWRTYERHFAKAAEYKDVEVLSLFVFPGGPFYGMKAPIKSMADLKGVKFYGLPGPAAQMLEAAGAGVVAVPAARSYEVISGGTVDAFAGYPVQDAGAFHTLQYVKWITDVPGDLTAPSFTLFVNKKKWQSIPEADRAAIKRLSGEAFAARSAVYDEIEVKARKDAAAQGVQFIKADAAFVDSLRPLAARQVDDWLAAAAKLGVDGKAALEMYKSEAASGAK